MKKLSSYQTWPLWAQITSALFIICSCIVYATGEYVYRIENHFLTESLEQNRQRVFNTISSTAIESIITEDIATLDTIVSELVKQNSDIYSFSITNEENKLLVKQGNTKPINKKHSLTHSSPIEYEGEIFGYIKIHWDMAQKYADIEEHIKGVYFFVSMMLILLSAISAFGIHLFVTRPLRNIENRLLGHATGESAGYENKMLSHEFIQLHKTIDKLESLTTSRNKLQKEVAVRKNAQFELAKARDEALKASRAKSTFLANMSHELRTPLNAILGYSEIIMEDAIENKHNSYVKDASKINNAGKHLLELISNILDLSKVEAGKMKLSITTTNLTTLIKTIAETIHPLIEKNNNTLKVEIPDDIGEIQNDDIKLKQIILNLLSNASKFTHQGVITLKVQQYIHENNDWIKISVTDTGIGVSNESLEKIFHSFSQADDSTSREYGGTGLGLDISQNFCWLMGGDLKVASELGKGSSFWLQIPAIVKSIPDTKIETKQQSDLPFLTTEEIRIGNNVQTIDHDRRKNVARIFIIEQDYLQEENMRLIIETDGLYVVAEADMDIAFDMIMKNPPNTIVINTENKKEKSFNLLDKLNANEKLKNIPVITLVENTLSTQFLTAGAKFQLPLQFDINVFMEKIKQSIRK